MSRCVSCVHWENPWDSEDDEDYIDRIAKEKVGLAARSRWGTCRKIDMPGDLGVTVDVLAFTQDGSDYAADLHTRADFGCVLWEAKP